MQTLSWASPLCIVLAMSLSLGSPRAQQAEQPVPEAFRPNQVENLAWRNLGPANMGGRITSLAVYEAVRAG